MIYDSVPSSLECETSKCPAVESIHCDEGDTLAMPATECCMRCSRDHKYCQQFQTSVCLYSMFACIVK
jgi:hypothetical protein